MQVASDSHPRRGNWSLASSGEMAEPIIFLQSHEVRNSVSTADWSDASNYHEIHFAYYLIRALVEVETVLPILSSVLAYNMTGYTAYIH